MDRNQQKSPKASLVGAKSTVPIPRSDSPAADRPTDAFCSRAIEGDTPYIFEGAAADLPGPAGRLPAE